MGKPDREYTFAIKRPILLFHGQRVRYCNEKADFQAHSTAISASVSANLADAKEAADDASTYFLIRQTPLPS